MRREPSPRANYLIPVFHFKHGVECSIWQTDYSSLKSNSLSDNHRIAFLSREYKLFYSDLSCRELLYLKMSLADTESDGLLKNIFFGAKIELTFRWSWETEQLSLRPDFVIFLLTSDKFPFGLKLVITLIISQSDACFHNKSITNLVYRCQTFFNLLW